MHSFRPAEIHPFLGNFFSRRLHGKQRPFRLPVVHEFERIRVPTLLLSARDDPFLPPEVLDRVAHEVAGNSALTAEFVERGGHVGFVAGSWPWSASYYAEQRAVAFLSAGGSQGSPALP